MGCHLSEIRFWFQQSLYVITSWKWSFTWLSRNYSMCCRKYSIVGCTEVSDTIPIFKYLQDWDLRNILFVDKNKYKRTKKEIFCFVGVIPFHGFSMYGKCDSYKLLKPEDCFFIILKFKALCTFLQLLNLCVWRLYIILKVPGWFYLPIL